MKKVAKVALTVLGSLIALYFIVRAVVEFFVVDYGDPSSYENAWGGPTLLGVLAVHSGPGVIAAVIVAVILVRRLRRKQDQQSRTSAH